MDRARAFGSNLYSRIEKLRKVAPWAKEVDVHWESQGSGQIKVVASAKVKSGKVVVKKLDYSLETALDKVFGALRSRLLKSKKDRGHGDHGSLSLMA